MEYKDFIARCKEIYADFTGSGTLEETYYPEKCRWGRIAEMIKKPRLIVKWSTGGVSGGSCWDSSDPQPYTNDDPPKELAILDAVLESICPNVSFLQYRALTAAVMKYDTYSVGEYYGNSTNYAYKTIDLQELFDYLKEKGLIE